jgi:hypothetical protein
MLLGKLTRQTFLQILAFNQHPQRLGQFFLTPDHGLYEHIRAGRRNSTGATYSYLKQCSKQRIKFEA